MVAYRRQTARFMLCLYPPIPLRPNLILSGITAISLPTRNTLIESPVPVRPNADPPQDYGRIYSRSIALRG